MDKNVSSKTGISIRARLILALILLCLPAVARAQTYSVLHEFLTYPDQPLALVQGSDGNFYGTTTYGSAHGYGTVFKMGSSGNLTTLHNFTGSDGSYPHAGLIQATDGNFYGTTYAGGASDYGTVFKMDSLGNLTTLQDFSGIDGAHPTAGLIQASDSNFYGTTEEGGTDGHGTVFKMDSLGNLTTLHSFTGSDGDRPSAGLIQASDGNFYGTTYYGGTSSLGSVFKMDLSGNLTTLHSFAGNDGSYPVRSLIQATDGNFYGTTPHGGANGDGTVFKMDALGNLTTLRSFTGSDGSNPVAGLIQASDGNLYGTTAAGGANGDGTVFRTDSSGNLTILHSFTGSDGFYPQAGLIQATDGNFYGTTTYGGAGSCYNGCGTVFRMDSFGNLTTLHSFANSDGAWPLAGLIQATDGNFYGTTTYGGANLAGVVFKMDSSGNLATLHSFTGSDGYEPRASLIQAPDGNFYGTTAYGGAGSCYNGCGTVFRMDSLGNLTTLHTFTGTDGNYPFAGLIRVTDGNFYGTTYAGGANGSGTVFKMDLSGNLTTVHSFTGSDGSNPFAGLIQASDGNLYGTTYVGGANGDGTVFRTDSSGNLTTLHSFTGGEGNFPDAGLIQATDGNFYGTTGEGGSGGCSYGCGTIFKIDSTGNLTTLHNFAGSDGADPGAGLIQATDGYFYGTTQHSGTESGGYGTVFKIDSSGNLTTLHSFTGTDGSDPYASLIHASDGNLYGTTYVGGAADKGVVFRLALCVSPVASSNSPVCSGQTLQLSAYPSAGATYSWTGPNGFASTLQAPTIPNATAADSGTYTVTVTAGTCAPAQATVNVAVNAGVPPAPVIASSLCVPANTSGLTASVTANAGDVYNWNLFGGTIDAGQGTNSISFTSGEAGTPMRFSVVESTTSCSGSDTKIVQVDFGDVPALNPFHDFICTIARNGITAGCGGGNFCPGNPVLRSQMAVFILRGEHGSTYNPPTAVGIFTDVPASNPFAPWIEQLYNEGITGGCATAPLRYCPGNPVSRAGLAVFLLVAEHGTGYAPPACAGLFQDVACPGPFTNFIEQLYNEGITGGCNATPLMYCPANSVTRAQMAVFLTATFSLP